MSRDCAWCPNTAGRWPLAFGLAGKLVILPAAALLAGLAFRVESPVFEVAVLESAMVAWGVLLSAATVPFWHWLAAH